MEGNIEKECSALGGLFMQIVNDMKGSAPVWEDFICKTTKFHNALKTTSIASSAFLESFQKVADLANTTKGATKDMGSALTKLCLRHKKIESRRKSFSRLLIDQLVVPLQEKMEDWKKVVINLDKEHAKEYKKARAEIKKAASDTIRLQKKAKKGKSDVQNRLEAALADINGKYATLEETERNAVRNAMIEQRSQFCHFVACLKPVMDEEIAMLTEITHLQEILEALCLMSSDPKSLPASSEQVILDIKGLSDSSTLTYQTPPSSPSSLGSRKSSMCSISSINSTSSDSTNKSSPGHHFRSRTISQLPPGVARLASISSQDSGFTSQDTLYLNPNSLKGSLPESSGSSSSSAGSSGGGAFPSSSIPTWANWPDPPAFPRQEGGVERPHTISAAFDKAHQRPALSREMFEPPEKSTSASSHYAVPMVPSQSVDIGLPPIPGPKPRGRAVAVPVVPDLTKTHGVQVPTYVNQNDLAKLAAERQQEDIPEEEETESGGEEEDELTDDDVITPTPKNPNRSMATHPAVQVTGQQSELAAALRELQASTAELEFSTNRHSVQCSSGYGTMSSTASEETVVDELDKTLTSLETEIFADHQPLERCATLPRNHTVGRSMSMRQNVPPAVAPRPTSHYTAGVVKRSVSAAGPKPPPPVRRNSSLSSAMTSETQQTQPKQQPSLPHTQSQPTTTSITEADNSVKTHRRSHSDGNSLEALDSKPGQVTVSLPSNEAEMSRSKTLPSPRSKSCSDELPPPPPAEILAIDIAAAVRKSSHAGTDSVSVITTSGETNEPKVQTPIYAEPLLLNSQETKPTQNTSDVSQDYATITTQEPSKEEKASSKTLQRHGSVVETHAELIQTLNIQFAARPAPGPIAVSPPSVRSKQGPVQPTPTQQKATSPTSGATSPHKSPPPVAAKPSKLTRSLSGGDRRKSTDKDNAISPSSETFGENSLAGQIRRGVKLRRTICNDRSAPRFSSHQ